MIEIEIKIEIEIEKSKNPKTQKSNLITVSKKI